eukprot:s1796_g19.t1
MQNTSTETKRDKDAIRAELQVVIPGSCNTPDSILPSLNLLDYFLQALHFCTQHLRNSEPWYFFRDRLNDRKTASGGLSLLGQRQFDHRYSKYILGNGPLTSATCYTRASPAGPGCRCDPFFVR